MYEMLENVKPGEQITGNEALMELKNASAGAQPKIQKMITEEEDTEKIGKYINESLQSSTLVVTHTTLQRTFLL